MALKKAPGGVEDLTLGMTTEQQIRKGQTVIITQINGSNIPYSNTQSVNQKIEQVDSKTNAVRNDIEGHKARTDNPHQLVASDVGAASEIHTHAIGDITNLQTELNNKSDLNHNHDGTYAFKTHEHSISQVTGLQTELDAKMEDGEAYLKSEYINESTGVIDAGKPIVTDSTGKIHPSLAGAGLRPQGEFTPVVGTEYPDTTGVGYGAWWMISGVNATIGYSFTSGDLDGRTVFNGDLLIYGEQAWILREGATENPDEYYKLDGSFAISAPFSGGGQQFKNASPATENGDLVEYSQISALATDYIRHDGTIAMTAPFDAGDNRLINVSAGQDPTDAVNLQQLDAVDTKIEGHLADTENPHEVTAAQVGAEPDLGLGTSGQILATNTAADGKEWKTLTKGDVGLGQVDNTSDVDKPISMATQDALDNIKTDTTLKGDTVETEDGTKAVQVADIADGNVGLGAGQTWQNVAANRELGIEYTNDTGRAIMVYVMLTNQTGGDTLAVNGEVDGMLIDIIISRATNEHDVEFGTIKILVPASSTYKVYGEDNSDPTYGIVFNWNELR